MKTNSLRVSRPQTEKIQRGHSNSLRRNNTTNIIGELSKGINNIDYHCFQIILLPFINKITFKRINKIYLSSFSFFNTNWHQISLLTKTL